MIVDTSGFLAAWGRLQGDISHGYSDAMRDAVAIAARNARESSLFKNRSGETRGTIQSNEFGAYGEVRMGGAAVFLESGTKPHVILPKTGNLLRFVMAGQVIFARKVNHPGTQPRPVMKNAAAAGGQALERGIEENTSEAVRRFNG